jgi:hypothetical protein
MIHTTRRISSGSRLAILAYLKAGALSVEYRLAVPVKSPATRLVPPSILKQGFGHDQAQHSERAGRASYERLGGGVGATLVRETFPTCARGA